MTKGSLNPFPSILIVETAVPASPPAGDQRLYIDPADHKLKRVNSSGTVTTVEGGSGGGGHTSQLAYVASTDLMSGTALTTTTWTDIVPNQSFTVSSGTSLVQINSDGAMLAGGGAATTVVAVRLIVDSAGTAQTKVFGSNYINSASQFVAPGLTGSLFITGLAAGSHTVKLQIYVNGTGHSAYLRASTQPNTEALSLQVIEWA